MTVFFLCFLNDQIPVGGARVLYRHVDILNQAGIAAAVVHKERGFRFSWFENSTSISSPPLALSSSDLLVLPEALAPRMSEMAPGVPKVVFNQNAHHTWDGIVEAAPHPYVSGGDLLGVVCVSRHNEALLRYAFPQARVERVPLSVDPRMFCVEDSVSPGRTIVYMPRKRSDHAKLVLALLRARGALEGWDVRALADMSTEEVATAMRRAQLFLSFSQDEGLGLPPLEAQACGAAVIGYTGQAGREAFGPDAAEEVPEGDVLAFARSVERFLSAAPDGQARARRSRWVHRHFSEQAEQEAVLRVYRQFLAEAHDRPPVRATLLPGDVDIFAGPRGPRRWLQGAGLRRPMRQVADG